MSSPFPIGDCYTARMSNPYGLAGVGIMTHLMPLMFLHVEGGSARHVVKGGALAQIDLLANSAHMKVYQETVNTSRSYHDSGSQQ